MRYVFRHGDYDRFGKEGKDPRSQRFLEVLQRLSNLTQRIFIDLDFPFSCEIRSRPYLPNMKNFMSNYLDRIERGVEVDSMHIPMNVKQFEQNPTRNRLHAI
ncbi:unnamed protein product, partial [Mesorhabditis spiculigera]